eukprot:TRINITY_DN739_c0_g9_i1.p1 TRINITY_DN739_c0_g9~~TRINITY_DN739_c0_g9_i1.p1  ORF type:complete len:272 (+),score=51.32 TRINITY_DN739_c0_g9_i1:1104-1919(+)
MHIADDNRSNKEKMIKRNEAIKVPIFKEFKAEDIIAKKQHDEKTNGRGKDLKKQLEKHKAANEGKLKREMEEAIKKVKSIKTAKKGSMYERKNNNNIKSNVATSTSDKKATESRSSTYRENSRRKMEGNNEKIKEQKIKEVKIVKENKKKEKVSCIEKAASSGKANIGRNKVNDKRTRSRVKEDPKKSSNTSKSISNLNHQPIPEYNSIADLERIKSSSGMRQSLDRSKKHSHISVINYRNFVAVRRIKNTIISPGVLDKLIKHSKEKHRK